MRLSCPESHCTCQGPTVSCHPAVPRTLLLNSWLQMPGNTLNLTFLTSHETTDLNWLLWHTGNRSPVLLQPGSRVSLTSHPGQVVLSIFNISHEWAGSWAALPSSSLSSPSLYFCLFFLPSSSFHLFIMGNEGLGAH